METHLQHQMLLRVLGLCELHRQQKSVLVGSWAFRLDLRVVAQAAQRFGEVLVEDDRLVAQLADEQVLLFDLLLKRHAPLRRGYWSVTLSWIVGGAIARMRWEDRFRIHTRSTIATGHFEESFPPRR